MTLINLNTAEWDDSPKAWDLMFGKTALLEGLDNSEGYNAILDFDGDLDGKAGLAIRANNPDGSGWADSSRTSDWPFLDRAFGRENWQQFLEEYAAECRAELSEDEDDE